MRHSDHANESKATRVMVAGAEAVAAAAEALRAGGLVALPTETVYGLGADATSGEAVARIYEAKSRPSFNPLISHVADLAAAQREGVFNADALALAEAFWPGPLTLVVPAAAGGAVCALARAGLDSVALRAPNHPVAREIIAAFGRPIAAPSANRSGRISPTTAAHVLQELDGRCDLIVDGGRCAVGLESSIVDCTGQTPALLRPGGVSREDIERVTGKRLRAVDPHGAITAPGMLASHYAPGAAVRLNAASVEDGEAALDFGGALGAQAMKARAYLDLSPRRDLRAAAAHLFDMLRRLDESGATRIAVAPIPREGVGEAINDRLARAAAPR